MNIVGSEYEREIILLRIIFLYFSPYEILAYNTKTRLSREKSFFLCAKETNRRNGEVIKNKKKTTKQKSIISKELLIIKVHLFLVFGRMEGVG